jgi:hypothetical protein
MTAYETWKYLHLLMFVFWIGTDLGCLSFGPTRD